VAFIRDVHVIRTFDDSTELTTLHQVLNFTFVTVFTVGFEDGFTVEYARIGAASYQYDVAFLSSGLFNFSCSDESILLCGVSGTITLLSNGHNKPSITVSAYNRSNAVISLESPEYFVNLKAADYEVDVASSASHIGEGYPLVSTVGATQLSIDIYFTVGSPSVGAVEMALSFDSAKLEFVSAVGGSDFNQLFDADSVTAGIVTFGGVTSAYLAGANNHIATLVFDIVNGTSGLAAFSGAVLSMADGNGKGLDPRPFGKVGEVVLDFSPGTRRRRDEIAQAHTVILRSATVVRTQRQLSSTISGIGCVVGIGPYPIGDVNGDCKFDTTDALITKLYLAISADPVAIVDFFDTMYTNGIILGDRNASAMDVDFNNRVMVADAAHMV
jgi:hypothetical protein